MLDDGNPRLRRQLLYAIIVLVAFVPIVCSTPNGLGLSYDSTQYLLAARNLLAGNGLSVPSTPDNVVPLTHFPPLYPAAVALFGAVFGDARRGAWLLNLVSTAFTIVLVGRLADDASDVKDGAKGYAGFGAAMATAIATDLAVDAEMLWSESIFIALVLAALLLLIRGIKRQSSSSVRDDLWLLPAAFATSMATLARYAGISLIAACVIAILRTSRFGPWIGLRRALVFGLVSGSPLALWLLPNLMRAHTVSDREIAAHVISRTDLLVGAKTLTRWVIPYEPVGIGRTIPVALIVGLVIYLIRKATGAASSPQTIRLATDQRLLDGSSHARLTISILASFAITYAVFLLVSISLADRATSLDARILSPAIPVILALVMGTACSVLFPPIDRTNEARGRRDQTRLRIMAGAAFSIYVFSHTGSLIESSRLARTQGLGLAPLGQSAYSLLAAVRAIPTDARVYSNFPGVIYALTDRVAYDLPFRHSPSSLKTNSSFGTELEDIVARDVDRQIFFVFFDAGSVQPVQATLNDARSRLIVASERFFDGGEIALVARR